MTRFVPIASKTPEFPFTPVLSDERIIEEVQKYPFIYDVKHKDYKNPLIRQFAFDAIEKTLKLEGVSVRWKSLRDKYVRERKLQKKASTSNFIVETKKWHLYDSMKFLIPFLGKTKSRGKIMPASEDVPNLNTMAQDENSLTTAAEDEANEVQVEAFEFEEDVFTPEDTLELPSKKWKSDETQQEAVLKIVDMDEKSKIDNFVCYIGGVLKELPPRIQDRCMFNIHKFIYEAKMELYENR